MPRTVAISVLKTHCLRLLEQVARERRELLVTKRGRPIARVVPVDDGGRDEALSVLRGTLIGGDRVEDFEVPLSWEARRR